MSAIFLGNNKKRKRGQFDVDDLDDAGKRKLREFERRAGQRSDDEECDEIHEHEINMQ